MFSQFNSINNPYTTTMPLAYNDNIDNDLPPVGSSPTISTPYLDSSMDTPYLDNNSTSPFLETVPDFSPYLMYASLGSVPPYIMNNLNGAKNLNDNKDDVCIARYLDGQENKAIAKLTHDPIAKFNGDPTALLIDKSKSPMNTAPINICTAQTKPSPTIKLETVTEEDSDSLFPPLTSSQVSSDSYNPPEVYDTKEGKSWEEMLGFEVNSPLSSEEGDFDLNEEAHTEKKEQVKQEESNKEQVSRKRKSSPNVTTEASVTPAKKRKNTKTAKKAKETKLFQCPLCDHVSKRRYNLSTHIKTHDKARVKEFDCTQCNKSFDRRHDRDRHLATVHRGEKSYTCDHCTAHFSRSDALDRHLIQKHEYDESDFIE